MTQARMIGVLIALSLGLSAVLFTRVESGAMGPSMKQVFQAQDPPEAIAALLAAAGFSVDDDGNGGQPLAAMEAIVIAGREAGNALTLKGIPSVPATMLTDAEANQNYIAQSAPLEAGRTMTTARGSAFPALSFQATPDSQPPKIQVGPERRTRLFVERAPGVYEPVEGEIAAGAFSQDKAMNPSFGSPFALSGKIAKGREAVGMLTMPVAAYRAWAHRIHHEHEEGRSGVVMKVAPGSLTRLEDGVPPGQPYVDATRLAKFELRATLRRGKAAKFEIRTRMATGPNDDDDS